MPSESHTTNIYDGLASLESNDESSTSPTESSTDSENEPKESANKENEIYDEDDDDDAWDSYFDLVAHEETHGRAPIFTRALLTKVKEQRDLLKTELKKEPSTRSVKSIKLPAKDGTSYKIWAQGNAAANTVDIEYMSRIEMCPEFQSQFGHQSWQIQLLREYNDCGKEMYFDAPYTFKTYARAPPQAFTNAAVEEFRLPLLKSKAFWSNCSSKKKLSATIQETASKCSPIKKIVCLGLGALRIDRERNDYCAILQYMAVFTMASILTEVNQKKDPKADPVRIVCQDPCYTEKDHFLLRKFAERDIDFVRDPDALLEIDASTLVVTVFLPVQMPLLQIITDLFAETPDKGPVAMICDSMALDPNERKYNWRDRDSPAVTRFLNKRYTRSVGVFKDHKLDHEQAFDLHGALGMVRGYHERYWLTRMDLFVRK